MKRNEKLYFVAFINSFSSHHLQIHMGLLLLLMVNPRGGDVVKEIQLAPKGNRCFLAF